jgi:hypothetical protein
MPRRLSLQGSLPKERAPKIAAAWAVVQDVLRQVQNYEWYYRLRARRRKPTDQHVFEATVSAVICDLIHHHLTYRPHGVFITRSKQFLGRKSRYRPLLTATDCLTF